MKFSINVPQERIADAGGNIAPTWYRFFSRIQKEIGDDGISQMKAAGVVVTEATEVYPNSRILTGGTGIGITFNTTQAVVALATSGVTAGTYGSASQVAQITVDAYGRATTVANVTITPAAIGAVPDTRTVTAGTGLTGGGALSANITLSLAVATASGTYTPTVTGVTNVSTSSASVCTYSRVGDIVTVAGKVNIGPTATGTTVVRLTLPIASNFGAATDANGTATCAAVLQCGAITADAANDAVVLTYEAQFSSAQDLFFTYQYKII